MADFIYQAMLGTNVPHLQALASDSIDSMVTDPPAAISFMGKEWDGDKGGRDQWIAYMASIWRECFRVLKPGASALVWALPRTTHWTVMALEDAGFEVRDRVSHIFGQGFPKSLNMGKEMDRVKGLLAQRPQQKHPVRPITSGTIKGHLDTRPSLDKARQQGFNLSPGGAALSVEGQQWEGWGTALKPALEDWWLVRKPLARGMSVAQNALTHGVGPINVDGCRIKVLGEVVKTPQSDPRNRRGEVGVALGHSRPSTEAYQAAQSASIDRTNNLGRWPSHLMMTHSPGCTLVGTKKVQSSGSTISSPTALGQKPGGTGWNKVQTVPRYYAGQGDSQGIETIEDWQCVEGCPMQVMDSQSGQSTSNPGPRNNDGAASMWGDGQGGRFYGSTTMGVADEGGASRYFTNFPAPGEPSTSDFLYASKCPGWDRQEGCDALYWARDDTRPSGFRAITLDEWQALPEDARAQGNIHPTVKSTALMTWLITLVTPPGGIVIDPFMGTGSTGKAAALGGWPFWGAEQDPDYWLIASTRLDHAVGMVASKAAKLKARAMAAPAFDNSDLPLFSFGE